jgi:hypothetical protein
MQNRRGGGETPEENGQKDSSESSRIDEQISDVIG